MKRLAVILLLAGCAAPALTDVTMVNLDGVDYPVRRVAAEPLGPTGQFDVFTDENGNQVEVFPPDPATMGAAPALRVGGTSDLDTAIRVMAQFCDRPYDEVKDYGAYGDPVWTDPDTGEVVFWLEC
jgi:hypothetical protein